MKVEKVALTSLVLDPANARRHAPKNLEAIKGSLAKFGQQKPIVVGKSNVVIAGNGTLEAARLLGWEKIDVVRTTLEGPEAIAFAIADNRTGELAEWDAGVLSETLKALQAMDFDLGSIGFDDKDLVKMIAAPVAEGLTDPDAVPENVETRCKPGDLWVLGKHRLLCGDSTNAQHVERLMGGEKADLWLTDPPYGVAYKGGTGLTIQNDNLPLEEMAEFWTQLATAALIATTDKAAYYWFACQGGDQMMMMMMMSISRAGWKVRHELIWVKDALVLSRCDYHYKHEPILYGWKQEGTHEWFGDRSQTSTLEVARPKRNDVHPTMKPVELIERLLTNSTKTTSKVLDTCLGSGTTLIACEKMGRQCFGLEIDPVYADVILTRWEQFTGKTALLSSDSGADVAS